MSVANPFDHALLDSLYRHSALAVFLIEVDEEAPLERRFTFIELNPVHERLTGFTSAWIHGRTPRELSPRLPDTVALAVEARYQACVDARSGISYEEMIPFEGRETWWVTTLNPVVDDQGRIVRIIGFANEITERKRLELQLEDERNTQIRFGERLRHLHRLSTADYERFQDLFGDYLAAGSEMFGLPLAVLTRAEGARAVVCATFRSGDRHACPVDLSLTEVLPGRCTACTGAAALPYQDEGALLALVRTDRTTHDHQAAARTHPCFPDVQVGAFISTPILVNGQLYSTLSFAGPEALPKAFSTQDVELIELMAESLGHAVELAEAEASLLASQKQALLARDAAEAANHAKSAFLSTMSHEVRTPLNGVLGFAELLRMDAGLSDEQRRHTDVIIRSGERLVALINDVLDLASVEAKRLYLERAPVDVHDLVAEHLQVHAARASARGLELSYEIAPDVPAVLLGDERRLGQVLSNLVANAVKFTHHGHVRVQVDAVPAPAPAAVETPDTDATGAETPKRLLRVGVDDSGIGIKSDHLARVFEPFYQSDGSITRRYEGSGLGLSICREFIHAMGGTLEAESTLGVGSRFTFTVPLAIPPRRRQVVTVMPTGSLAGRRALVVDDDSTNRDLLATLLARWGMEAVTVHGPEDARALFAQEAFDVGLLDYGLQASSGVELAHTLQAEGVTTPLVLLTSYNVARADDVELFEAVLPKPIDTATLERTLQRLFASAPPAPAAGLTAAAPAPTLWISKGRPVGDSYADLRVIVAEDDPANRTLAHAMLGQVGIPAVFVEHGQALLDRLAAEPFDVVLLDIMMPVMNGLVAAQHIHTRYGDARPYLIALSAKAMRADREEIAAAGIDGFVAKPFSLRTLTAALDKAKVVRATAC